MTAGVVLLNFGEPEEASREAVVPYLERIFLSNMSLEGDMTEEEAHERARTLAERRAPGLLEEYDEVGGGSPLIPQAREQAASLETALEARGHDVETYIGMQYTEPFIEDAVAAAADDAVDPLIGLPVYPLCGQTTTVESLQMAADAAEGLDTVVDLREIAGWHRLPSYEALRAGNLAAFADEEGVTLDGDDALLLFSAHGTPMEYLGDDGVRYERYVEEHCAAIADRIGVDDYRIGYQNHENRDVAWTEPETEDVVKEAAATFDDVVVEPISFLHEQSETLSELDVELQEECEEAGIGYHRVPVPHDHPDLGGVLADLVEPFVVGDPLEEGFAQCQCRDAPGTLCLNGDD